MIEYYKRNLFCRLSSYQRRLLTKYIISAFCVCSGLTLYTGYVHSLFLKELSPFWKREIVFFDLVYAGTVFCIWVTFGVMTYWGLRKSSGLVGAFDRIEREFLESYRTGQPVKIRAREEELLPRKIVRVLNRQFRYNDAFDNENNDFRRIIR